MTSMDIFQQRSDQHATGDRTEQAQQGQSTSMERHTNSPIPSPILVPGRDESPIDTMSYEDTEPTTQTGVAPPGLGGLKINLPASSPRPPSPKAAIPSREHKAVYIAAEDGKMKGGGFPPATIRKYHMVVEGREEEGDGEPPIVIHKRFEKPRNEDEERAIRREVRIHKFVSKHPHAKKYICRLIEIICDADDGSITLVIEFAGGGDLFHKIVQDTYQGYEDDKFAARAKIARNVFFNIFEIVHFLKDCGIAHLDLHISNFVIGHDRRVKLIDWGEADHSSTWVTGGLTKPRGAKGIQSPEMHLYQPYDGHKSDLYSLGVLLFTLYFGHLPSQGHRDAIVAGTWLDWLKTTSPPGGTRTFYELIDHEAIELMSHLMQPVNRRANIESVFHHPYVYRTWCHLQKQP